MSRNTQADALPQWAYILVVTLLIPFAIILTLALTGMNVFGHMDHGGIHVHTGGDNLHIAFAMAHVLRMDRPSGIQFDIPQHGFDSL